MFGLHFILLIFFFPLSFLNFWSLLFVFVSIIFIPSDIFLYHHTPSVVIFFLLKLTDDLLYIGRCSFVCVIGRSKSIKKMCFVIGKKKKVSFSFLLQCLSCFCLGSEEEKKNKHKLLLHGDFSLELETHGSRCCRIDFVVEACIK